MKQSEEIRILHNESKKYINGKYIVDQSGVVHRIEQGKLYSL